MRLGSSQPLTTIKSGTLGDRRQEVDWEFGLKDVLCLSATKELRKDKLNSLFEFTVSERTIANVVVPKRADPFLFSTEIDHRVPLTPARQSLIYISLDFASDKRFVIHY